MMSGSSREFFLSCDDWYYLKQKFKYIDRKLEVYKKKIKNSKIKSRTKKMLGLIYKKQKNSRTKNGLWYVFYLFFEKKEDKISAPFIFYVWEETQKFVAKKKKCLYLDHSVKNILIDGKKCRAVLLNFCYQFFFTRHIKNSFLFSKKKIQIVCR